MIVKHGELVRRVIRDTGIESKIVKAVILNLSQHVREAVSKEDDVVIFGLGVVSFTREEMQAGGVTLLTYRLRWKTSPEFRRKLKKRIPPSAPRTKKNPKGWIDIPGQTGDIGSG